MQVISSKDNEFVKHVKKLKEPRIYYRRNKISKRGN